MWTSVLHYYIKHLRYARILNYEWFTTNVLIHEYSIGRITSNSMLLDGIKLGDNKDFHASYKKEIDYLHLLFCWLQ